MNTTQKLNVEVTVLIQPISAIDSMRNQFTHLRKKKVHQSKRKKCGFSEKIQIFFNGCFKKPTSII